MLWEWIWNQIPWWVFAAIAIIVIGFCWQWIAPIWFILPKWLRWTIAFIVAIIVAVQYGRNRGVHGERERRKQLNAEAVKQREAIDERVKNLPPNAVSDALRRRGWMFD
jgi:hypothetical protein